MVAANAKLAIVSLLKEIVGPQSQDVPCLTLMVFASFARPHTSN